MLHDLLTTSFSKYMLCRLFVQHVSSVQLQLIKVPFHKELWLIKTNRRKKGVARILGLSHERIVPIGRESYNLVVVIVSLEMNMNMNITYHAQDT